MKEFTTVRSAKRTASPYQPLRREKSRSNEGRLGKRQRDADKRELLPHRLKRDRDDLTRDTDLGKLPANDSYFMNYSENMFGIDESPKTNDKVLKLSEISLRAVAANCNSINAKLLHHVDFVPVGQQLFATIVSKNKMSLKILQTFVEVYSAQMATESVTCNNNKKLTISTTSEIFNRRFFWGTYPMNLVKELHVTWLVMLEISEKAGNFKHAVKVIIHLPMISALQFWVRAADGLEESAVTDRVLNSYAKSMIFDNKWHYLRVLIIKVLDGKTETPRGITRAGIQNILAVPQRIRYLECAEALLPLEIEQGVVKENGQLDAKHEAGRESWLRTTAFWLEDAASHTLHTKYETAMQLVGEQPPRLPAIRLCFGEMPSPDLKSLKAAASSKQMPLIDGILLRIDNRRIAHKKPAANFERHKASIVRNGVQAKHKLQINSLLDMSMIS
ncbi:uncharacterized protein V2V93DRAFT_371785 [Kockiozyma suomiensis]|uniref:uncharacterized protein n=1 Tax=Kockiozyma suomiensis TaxID=1337062 RepID=UPI003343EBDB